MPVELARRCIEIGSPAGGRIVDPSGDLATTAVAARACGRSAVCTRSTQPTPTTRAIGCGLRHATHRAVSRHLAAAAVLVGAVIDTNVAEPFARSGPTFEDSPDDGG